MSLLARFILCMFLVLTIVSSKEIVTGTGGEGKSFNGDTCSSYSCPIGYILLLLRDLILPPVGSPGHELKGNLQQYRDEKRKRRKEREKKQKHTFGSSSLSWKKYPGVRGFDAILTLLYLHTCSGQGLLQLVAVVLTPIIPYTFLSKHILQKHLLQ